MPPRKPKKGQKLKPYEIQKDVISLEKYVDHILEDITIDDLILLELDFDLTPNTIDDEELFIEFVLDDEEE